MVQVGAREAKRLILFLEQKISAAQLRAALGALAVFTHFLKYDQVRCLVELLLQARRFPGRQIGGGIVNTIEFLLLRIATTGNLELLDSARATADIRHFDRTQSTLSDPLVELADGF